MQQAKSNLAHYGITGFAFIVLMVVFGLQAARVRNASAGDLTSPRIAGYLANKVPEAITGWQMQEVPLGSTELLQGQVASILNFDDYLFREFTRGHGCPVKG